MVEAPLPRLTSRWDVQGLRALAVAVVILGHAHLPGFRGGFVGVDVFFVVSGFVISSLLLHEATSTGRVRVGAFYARRARRILPAVGVVLVATSVFAAVRLPFTRVSELVTDVRWSALFAANVHFSRLGTNYFEQGRAVSPVQHLWSLAVEEQFYLVWPVLLMLVFAVVSRGRQLRVTWILVTATWLASLAWSVVLTTRSPVPAYFSTLTRTWELATGALLALAAHWLLRLGERWRNALALAGLAAIATAVVTYDETTAFPGWRAVVPVAGTAAVIAAGAAGTVAASRALTLRPMRYVGDISYSLYLWHWPVLVFGAYLIGHRPGGTQAALLVVIVVVLSVLSYHLLENPIRHQRFRLVNGFRGLALWPVVLVLVLGTATWAQAHSVAAFRARVNGTAGGHLKPAVMVPDDSADAADSAGQGTSAPRSLPDPPLDRLIRDAVREAGAGAAIPFPLVNFKHLHRDVWQSKFDCYAEWEQTKTRVCPRGDVEATRTVVLYGDSHAGMWLPPLNLLGERDGFRLVPLIKLGCGPFDVVQLHWGAPFPTCPPFRSWALHQMKALHPDVIVVAYRSLLEVVPPDGQSPTEAWRAGAERSLSQLGDLASRVVVISDITATDFSPADCLADVRATMATCTQTEQSVGMTGNTLTREAARQAGTRFADVTGLVCVRHRCPLVVGRVVTYHDEGHITLTWSKVVTVALGRKLALDGG